ncbi:MAG: PucR family transcriptional regulator [Arachnia sp.]
MSSQRARSALLKRLRAVTAELNTSTLTALESRHTWFAELDPQSRSWIGVLARKGIDGFVNWFAGDQFEPEAIFAAAPRSMAGRISLQQTVDVVRTTTDVVEEQTQQLMPRGDKAAVQLGVIHYSREVAFAAAAIYARAAESRGAWDSRIEATVVDAVVRAETNESVLSRASTLGWDTAATVVVAIGAALREADLDNLRRAASRTHLDLLAAPQGDRVVCIFAGEEIADPVSACAAIAKLESSFAPGPIVVGPPAAGLTGAPLSARAAASGYRAASAWAEGPRTLLSADLLPERAVAGDGHARRTLSIEIFGALSATPELLDTCVAYLGNGGSLEATARELFVHPNTVRYRLKRIQDATGYTPSDPREAYVLRLAITLGRLQQA